MASNRNNEEKIARLKSLALEAKNAGDMVKAKEYIIQLKVRRSFVFHTSPSSPYL